MQRRIRLSSPGASSRGGANPDRAAEIDVGNGAEKQSPVAPDTNARNLAGRHAGGALRCGEIETREPCVVGFLLVRTALDAPDNWEGVDWVTVARHAGPANSSPFGDGPTADDVVSLLEHTAISLLGAAGRMFATD